MCRKQLRKVGLEQAQRQATQGVLAVERARGGRMVLQMGAALLGCTTANTDLYCIRS
jgi:hypothetical protein